MVAAYREVAPVDALQSIGGCPETASFVTEGDDGLSADVPEPSE
jgi:hypothetical protein